MAQLGFFDLTNRYAGLDRKGDPLALLASLVPWETFRPKLKRALLKAGLRTRAGDRRSAAGRKPWDAIVIFKALILQSLYTLSDEQAEYQIRDRLSFMRFLGLGLEDPVPDATIVEAPPQQNTAEGTIKAGRQPEGWTVPKTRQKDKTHVGRRRTARVFSATRTTSALTANTNWSGVIR